MAWLLLGAAPAGSLPLAEDGPASRVEGARWTGVVLQVAMPRVGPPDDATLAGWAMAQSTNLSRLVVTADVLPVALGSVFSTKDAAAAYLDTCGHLFDHAFDAVRGHVEYTLELLHDEPDQRDAGSAGKTTTGLAYLSARRAARDQRRIRAMERSAFASRLRPGCKMHAAQIAERPARAGRIAAWGLLVPRGAVSALSGCLQQEAAQARALGLRLKLVGPSPAFSFVQGADADAKAAI